MEAAWIVNDAVFNAVQRVAGSVNRISNDLRFGRRHVSISLHELCDQQMTADKETGQIVGWIACDDSVKIVREPLRLRQRLLPAARAPCSRAIFCFSKAAATR